MCELGFSGHQREVLLHSYRKVVQEGFGLHLVLGSLIKVVEVVGDITNAEGADCNLVMHSNQACHPTTKAMVGFSPEVKCHISNSLVDAGVDMVCLGDM